MVSKCFIMMVHRTGNKEKPVSGRSGGLKTAGTGIQNVWYIV